MDLWQLKVFCSVVEQHSFSKAGRRVHLSQPTVSSHIKELEDHIGCRLIDRLSRRATPTKAGELLYDYAIRLLALRDEAESALAEFQGKLKGRLVLGGSTIPGGYILPQLIGDFQDKYPEVTIALVVGDTQNIIEETLAGGIELGLIGAKAKDHKILQESLIEDALSLVIPADHKWAGRKSIGLEQLKREPFIVREYGSGTLKSLQNSLAAKNISIDALNVVAEMGSTQSLINGILHNVGVSILSTIAVAEYIRMGTLKTLAVSGLRLKRNFYLIRRQHRTLSPLGRAFIEYLKTRYNH